MEGGTGLGLALVHKIYRAVFHVMIPVATEGVILGASLLGHVVGLVLLGTTGFRVTRHRR